MTQDELADLMEATWPPARAWREGAFVLRDGDGGGKRVSAASLAGDWNASDLYRLETAMPEPLVLIRPDEVGLDRALARRGWQKVDPVLAYAAPVTQLAESPLPQTVFAHWPPLQIARTIWAKGGIGPARIRVMERVQGHKCALLARHGDHPAGVAFVACQGTQAMLHALEVRPDHRRQGLGATLLRAAATWAQDQKASQLSLVVTRRNATARALYLRLGMRVVGQYHYRMK